MKDPTVRPLRLLYLAHQFYPEYRNGTEKFVLQLARAMQARKHRVQVVTYWEVRARRLWHWLGFRLLQRRYSYAGIPVLALSQPDQPHRFHRLIENERQRSFALRYLRQWRPDLVHVGHVMRVSGFVWAAQELGIPTVLTLTDYWLICPKFKLLNSEGVLCSGPAGGAVCSQACAELDPAFTQRRLAQAAQIAQRAAAVVAPSQYLAATFQREWPWLTPQIVAHGIQPWTCNTRRYLRGDALVFAYAGSLTRHKGVQTLIAAFRGVQSNASRLLIHGAGQYEAALRALAAGDPRIEFCGIYNERGASRVFDTMDVLVAPSEWPENRPFVVYEALASGVPAIVSAVGGMTDAVEDGATGFVIPPNDVAALRAVLQRLADAPEELNRLKDRIAGLTVPTTSMEADAYVAIYREVLGASAQKQG